MIHKICIIRLRFRSLASTFGRRISRDLRRTILTVESVSAARGSNDSGGVSQLDALLTGFADRSNRFNSAFEYVVSHSNLNGKASDESKKKIKIMINNFI